jgi:crotonobetainyl-CoA:carnitine CoA-transferase CaiB-like acyl-CoA transferase
VGIPTLGMLAGADVPRYVPNAMVDRIVGTSAANAVTAALYFRERTGKGQRVDVPMFETMTQFVLGDHMSGHTFDPPAGPAGYARLLNDYRKPYVTKDGHVCVLIYNDKQWKAFFDVIGEPERMRDDPRFASIASRTEHIRDLYRMVSEVMVTRTTGEWLALLESADIPVMPLNTIESLMADPHLNATGFFRTVEHPSEGRVRSMAVASRFSESPPELMRHAPRLGEHSAEILREAGYTDAAIAALAAKGVTLIPPTPPAPDASHDKEDIA